jgi:predicted nucleotidyltransferase
MENLAMRLSNDSVFAIKQAVTLLFGKDAKVYLFGSRTDDAKNGGDIDLYIETDSSDAVFDKKLSLLTELRKRLGDQKIDVVINNFTKEKDIHKIAKNTGILL